MIPVGAPNPFEVSQAKVQELVGYVQQRKAQIFASIYLNGRDFSHAVPLNIEESYLASAQVLTLKFKPSNVDTFFSYGGGGLHSRIAFSLFTQQGNIRQQQILGVVSTFFRVKAQGYHLADASRSTKVKIAIISRRQLTLLENDILKTGAGSLASDLTRNVCHSTIHHDHVSARRYANDQGTIDQVLRESKTSSILDVNIGQVQEIMWDVKLDELYQRVKAKLAPPVEEEIDTDESDSDDDYDSEDAANSDDDREVSSPAKTTQDLNLK